MNIYAWILFGINIVYFLFLLPAALKAHLLKGLYYLVIIAFPVFYFVNYLFLDLNINMELYTQSMLMYSSVICIVSIISHKNGGWLALPFFLPQVPFYALILYPNLLNVFK